MMPNFKIHPKAALGANMVKIEPSQVADVLTAVFGVVGSKEQVEATHIVPDGPQVVDYDTGFLIDFEDVLIEPIPVVGTVEEVKQALGL